MRPAFLLLLLLPAALQPVAALAAAADTDIDWFRVLMGLFGGLAMFLFGMDQMSEGLKAAAGDRLRDILANLTRNRVLGAITGALVTAVLNSSSVTTVLVVGFISAGLMSLAQSVGIIMGANVGSTVTAQIVAFNVTQYALIPVAVGFFMLFTARRENTRHYGGMIMGLGLVFYGMGVMGEAMDPMRSYPPFLELMAHMETPLLGILIGALFTGLVQSSAATTGIAIVMASSGLITLTAGIALAFGANIGTCVTAILAAIGKPVEAVRAAMVHVLFNVAGVTLWFFFIPELAAAVTAISPSHPELAGKARIAAEVPRQIANAHTLFNVANTLVFLGFTNVFARLVERLVPERRVEEKRIIEPLYLDREVLEVPAMALEQVRFEIGHMGEIISIMLSTLRSAVGERDRERCDEVRRMDDQVDILHDAILEYLSDLRQQMLTDQQSEEFQALMSAVIHFENLADIIESELVDIGEEIISLGRQPSEASFMLLTGLADTVHEALENAIRAVRDGDEQAAAAVISAKDQVSRTASEMLKRQSDRIGLREKDHLMLVRLELELLDKLRQIYTLAKRIAKEFVPEEVASKA